MTKLKPIPVFGVPAIVNPDTQLLITLYWHPVEGINFNRNGQPTTVAQLERAIEKARSHLDYLESWAIDVGLTENRDGVTVKGDWIVG